MSTQRPSHAQPIAQPLARLRTALETAGEERRPERLFRDDGYRGATLNRPGLERLRDAIKGAEIDRGLLTTPDRVARTDLQQMVLLEELAHAGRQVEILERPMRQAPPDQLLWQIRSAVAECERTLMTARMRRGRQRKRRAGIL